VGTRFGVVRKAHRCVGKPQPFPATADGLLNRDAYEARQARQAAMKTRVAEVMPKLANQLAAARYRES
jgi:hypothetical protein